jgi:predicted permease
MNAFTIALITTLFFISIGYISTRLGLLDVKTGRTLYRFLFTIPLPIVVFTSLATAKNDLALTALPLIGGLLAITLVASSFVIGKLFKFDRKSLGTLMTAAGITSTLSFALPFILVFYGQDAARYLFLYDFGGALVVWTFVYYISGVMGNKRGQKLSQSAANFMKAPMLWALVLGLVLSFTDIALPSVVISISARLTSFISVLILMCIGIFLKFDFFRYKKNLTKIVVGIFITMGLSIILAYVLTSVFGVTGSMQKVVLISALAPAGALTVPFCAEHDLDTEYASALVALATAFSVIVVLFFIGA